MTPRPYARVTSSPSLARCGSPNWVWAVGTPFVKIGRTQYQADRDGRWQGKAELARRRVREWSTGCMYPVQLIRVHLAGAEHEAIEHDLCGAARVTREREWFDLRRM
jgi:hypothetical protein